MLIPPQIITLPSPQRFTSWTEQLASPPHPHSPIGIAEMKSGFICKEDQSPMALCPSMMSGWVQLSESSGNSGTNFIMSFANNKYSSKAYDIDIYLSAAVNHDVAINVSAPKFQDFDINFSFSLTPGTSKHLNIDDKFRMPAGTGISPRTLVITASDLIDVVGVNLYASNGDAFLAIPDRYLGNEYMAVTYIPSSSTAASFLTVSAGTGSDVTLLSITFPRWTGNEQVPMNGTLYGAGEVARVSLMSLETLQIQTNYDLTGTFVKSDHPVSVYSGVNRTSVYSTTCLSQLLDQMPPVDRAGKSYVTVPFPKRDIGDLYRIVATDDDTVLSVPNSVSVNLTRRGDFHETYVSANTFYYVTATKPVVVAQISVSRTSSSDKYGDPSLVILTPTEGAYGNASFSRASYPNSFVTIVMLKQDQAGIRFDHEPLPANQEWFLVEGNASYTATQVLVGSSDTPRTIYHSGGAKFVAYFHTGTTCEAQAMSLGLSLPVINDPCKVSISEPGDGLDNDCDGHVDEEACCLNIDIADNDGDGRFNEDCVGVSGKCTHDKYQQKQNQHHQKHNHYDYQH
ncbi:uncharacterized protein LOC121389834 [Gigantopelta aegis]|uniref:uncharacterized protein LOC121389834 n=1 Tax=Gigantopelta aegis TaxID=1735272 RepID=UPI001B88C3E5|nr:uncharacterized protein LOC121389834 [Gigantopelta aegis]